MSILFLKKVCIFGQTNKQTKLYYHFGLNNNFSLYSILSLTKSCKPFSQLWFFLFINTFLLISQTEYSSFTCVLIIFGGCFYVSWILNYYIIFTYNEIFHIMSNKNINISTICKTFQFSSNWVFFDSININFANLMNRRSNYKPRIWFHLLVRKSWVIFSSNIFKDDFQFF